MTGTPVQLTIDEVEQAGIVAVQRMCWCLRNGGQKFRERPRHIGLGHDLLDWFEGAGAEVAVSKLTGLPWSGFQPRFPTSDLGRYIEVKSTGATNYGMMVRKFIKDKVPYVFCRTHDFIEDKRLIHVIGWVWGHEVRATRVDTLLPRPAHHVYVFRPLDTLEDKRCEAS